MKNKFLFQSHIYNRNMKQLFFFSLQMIVTADVLPMALIQLLQEHLFTLLLLVSKGIQQSPCKVSSASLLSWLSFFLFIFFLFCLRFSIILGFFFYKLLWTIHDFLTFLLEISYSLSFSLFYLFFFISSTLDFLVVSRGFFHFWCFVTYLFTDYILWVFSPLANI